MNEQDTIPALPGLTSKWRTATAPLVSMLAVAVMANRPLTLNPVACKSLVTVLVDMSSKLDVADALLANLGELKS